MSTEVTEQRGGGRAPRVVVVGGGVTGLTAAREVHRSVPGCAVTVLEERPRVGGNIITERTGDGFLIDGGPDSFVRTKPSATELVKELGLEQQLITVPEEAHGVFIAKRGQLERMPEGLMLGVPTRFTPLITTGVVTWPGKLRMAAELMVPRGRGGDRDESIDSFISRRLGREATETLAAPLLSGIYAGDPKRLSMRATFPQMIALEEKYGSLVRGMVDMRLMRAGEVPGEGLKGAWRRARALFEPTDGAQSPFYSLRDGMGSLIDALAASLPDGAIRTGAPAVALGRSGGGWVVNAGGEQLHADAVVLACPARVAAGLVSELDAALASELGGIPYVSTATIFFAFDRAQMPRELNGVGFVVPKGEGKILAGTWVSTKWSGRAPDDKVLVRAFVGGARGDVDPAASDDELQRVALQELRRLMGPLGEPELVRVFRYIDSNPQPVVGHEARLERIERRLVRHPGLHVAGASYDGVGIPDCVRQARSAARRVAERLVPGVNATA